MTTTVKHQRLNLQAHRPWENLASIALGAAILATALLLGEDRHPAMTISAGITGLIVLALGGLEIFSFRRWEERLEIVSGLWLAVAPWVLVYEGLARNFHVVLGLGVYILGLVKFWKDRKIEANR